MIRIKKHEKHPGAKNNMKNTSWGEKTRPRRALRADKNTNLASIKPRTKKYKKDGSPRDPQERPSFWMTL